MFLHSILPTLSQSAKWSDLSAGDEWNEQEKLLDLYYLPTSMHASHVVVST